VNTRLAVLGINIVLVSAFLAVYGLLVNDNGLVGLAMSAGIVGGVLIVYSTAPGEPSLEAVLSYTTLLVDAVTAVLEDLDLLNGKVCVLNTGRNALVLYSKGYCAWDVNPGVGFVASSPYFSVPVHAFADTAELEELNGNALESALNALLVDELGLCESIKVEQRGEVFSVNVIGIAKTLTDYARYPLNPVTLLTLIAVSKLAGRGKVYLVDRQEAPRTIRLVVRVEKGA